LPGFKIKKKINLADARGQFWDSQNGQGLQDLHARRCGSDFQTSGWKDGLEAQAKAPTLQAPTLHRSPATHLPLRTKATEAAALVVAPLPTRRRKSKESAADRKLFFNKVFFSIMEE
jgi:hypothetical protein